MLGALAARDSRKALRSFLIAAGFKRHGPELVYLAAIYSGLYIIPSEPDEVRASLVDGDLAKKYYNLGRLYYPNNISIMFIGNYLDFEAGRYPEGPAVNRLDPTFLEVSRLLEAGFDQKLSFDFYAAQTASWISLDLAVMSKVLPLAQGKLSCKAFASTPAYSQKRPNNYLPSFVKMDEVLYLLLDMKVNKLKEQCNEAAVVEVDLHDIHQAQADGDAVADMKFEYLEGGKMNSVVRMDVEYLMSKNK
ncbi:hypothetical protein FAZ21_03060 [Chitiniphilus eburneus]|uniref:Uncharacterized protein n=2 Tax=Chitiniphilus eburneus TaxID=2571148 RepID=A0A4U0Q7X4_9NEIS|nr:hypothetical protein FAZ21_03060 [Chitiniphilus eburneus]